MIYDEMLRKKYNLTRDNQKPSDDLNWLFLERYENRNLIGEGKLTINIVSILSIIITGTRRSQPMSSFLLFGSARVTPKDVINFS